MLSRIFAFIEASRRIGSGLVTWTADGGFLHTFTSSRPGGFSPRMAEVYALRLSLEQASTRCMGRGVVFTDAQSLVHALRSDVPDWSEFGSLIQDCRILLEQRPDISVSWVSRRDNFFVSPPVCNTNFL
ncbi:hypothetical protein K2173_023162 [Erythroxylum novogranatense]|uniref:RNase H type-1 domain-containing protein n=1 Tax=Erythroxylum novogranatense TaxID=1862640 RepID=A0AAV8U7P5_9ROSI|nr:hypothetical protein K2173_023162 [Erythroxylum novogranatense]